MNTKIFPFRTGDIPPTRWIVNFDRDLLDGLVLAAQVANYCPYLVRVPPPPPSVEVNVEYNFLIVLLES